MTYKEQHDLEQAQIQKDAAQLRDKEQLYNLYVRRRDLVACDAASAVILSYFNGVPLTQDKLDEALQNPELLKQLPRHQTDADLRANLIQEIENLLQGSPQSIQHTVANLRYLTIAEVAEKRDELKRRQAVRELPKDELKVMARGVEASRFQPVPAIYQTRSMLLDLVNSPNGIAEFKSLVKRCGEVAINKVLANKN